jgi:hypothetical protein
MMNQLSLVQGAQRRGSSRNSLRAVTAPAQEHPALVRSPVFVGLVVVFEPLLFRIYAYTTSQPIPIAAGYRDTNLFKNSLRIQRGVLYYQRSS